MQGVLKSIQPSVYLTIFKAHLWYWSRLFRVNINPLLWMINDDLIQSSAVSNDAFGARQCSFYFAQIKLRTFHPSITNFSRLAADCEWKAWPCSPIETRLMGHFCYSFMEVFTTSFEAVCHEWASTSQWWIFLIWTIWKTASDLKQNSFGWKPAQIPWSC